MTTPRTARSRSPARMPPTIASPSPVRSARCRRWSTSRNAGDRHDGGQPEEQRDGEGERVGNQGDGLSCSGGERGGRFQNPPESPKGSPPTIPPQVGKPLKSGRRLPKIPAVIRHRPRPRASAPPRTTSPPMVRRLKHSLDRWIDRVIDRAGRSNAGPRRADRAGRAGEHGPADRGGADLHAADDRPPPTRLDHGGGAGARLHPRRAGGLRRRRPAVRGGGPAAVRGGRADGDLCEV